MLEIDCLQRQMSLPGKVHVAYDPAMFRSVESPAHSLVDSKRIAASRDSASHFVVVPAD